MKRLRREDRTPGAGARLEQSLEACLCLAYYSGGSWPVIPIIAMEMIAMPAMTIGHLVSAAWHGAIGSWRLQTSSCCFTTELLFERKTLSDGHITITTQTC